MNISVPMRLMTGLKILSLIVIASCESEDRRLAEYVQRAAETQARQNERMADQSEAIIKQSQEVAAAAHGLVEQDAAARREIIQAQEKLQQQNHVERTSIESQRQQLDRERKAAVEAAVHDPVVAQAILSGGLILAALLPLLVCIYALRRLPEQRPIDELVGETLLQSLVIGAPVLDLQRPPAPLLDSAAEEPPGERLPHN